MRPVTSILSFEDTERTQATAPSSPSRDDSPSIPHGARRFAGFSAASSAEDALLKPSPEPSSSPRGTWCAPAGVHRARLGAAVADHSGNALGAAVVWGFLVYGSAGAMATACPTSSRPSSLRARPRRSGHRRERRLHAPRGPARDGPAARRLHRGGADGDGEIQLGPRSRIGRGPRPRSRGGTRTTDSGHAHGPWPEPTATAHAQARSRRSASFR